MALLNKSLHRESNPHDQENNDFHRPRLPCCRNTVCQGRRRPSRAGSALEGRGCCREDHARAKVTHGGLCRRKEPAEGTEQDLFGKAIAIEDRDGNRVVFVTLDLIGVLDKLRTDVATQVQEKYELPPRALLMNASHTHCGPAYGREDAKDYFDSLATTLVDLVGQSLEQLQPAKLSYSFARVAAWP